MRFFAVLLSTILLAGCARKAPVSETIADSAINTTTALEQSLTPECKTDNVITQLAVIRTQIRAVSNACDAEKEQIDRERLKWFWAFWGLVCVIGAYAVRKILK